MIFFRWNKNINPLISILSGLFIIIFGLVTAKTLVCSYFLLTTFILLMFFGCFKQCIKILPMFIVVGSIFFGIAYASTRTFALSYSMTNRIGALFLAMVPGMATSPVKMTRSLSVIHAPRSITLGMLIAMSFVPLLSTEIKRVREAMKTRGAGSVLNPKIFYRALLLPFVMRLINISDTLALSVETRGFTLSKAPYTIYDKPPFSISDVVYMVAVVILGGVWFII